MTFCELHPDPVSWACRAVVVRSHSVDRHTLEQLLVPVEDDDE